MRFKKNCIRCNEEFRPSGKSSRLCPKCRRARVLEGREKYKETCRERENPV